MPLALFTFHHLLSTKKISSLRSLSKTLQLRGVYKKGYPGLLFVSSASLPSVKAFVKEVKQMRWQTCTLCGIDELMEVDFRERGLEEVSKIRDVVRLAAERAGEWEREWVVARLGFGKED